MCSNLKSLEACGSYSIHHCRNVSVLPKKLAVCDCDDTEPRVTTLLSSYAPRSKLSACFRPSCRPKMKKKKKTSPCTRMYVSKSLWKNGTEMRRLEKILQSSRLERDALPTVGLHPGICALSFAISHTHLAALPWGPRPAVERGRHAPHQHRSELNSRQRRRQGKSLQLEKRLPDTQHRVGLAEFPADVGLPRRSARPFVARPRFRFGGVLVHLHVPQILNFLLTSSSGLMWVQWSALDVIISFRLLLGLFVRILTFIFSISISL